MSANIDFPTNKTRRLDRIPEARAPITEEDVSSATTLARLLDRLLRDLSRLLGLWRPRRLDFERVPLDATGTVKTRLEHKFGGAVRCWVVSWDGAASPNIRPHADTTAHTLVLTSTSDGTATIRVEEAG
jgi:hypothetical protein